MVKPDYYPLKKAAEMLALDENDLLNMGANGKLDIFVLVGGHAIAKKIVIDSTGAEVSVAFGSFPGNVVLIERSCIQSHEAGLPARITFATVYGRDNVNSEVYTIVNPMTEDGDLMTAGDFMMKDAKLVIMAHDLKRLQESEPQAEDLKNKIKHIKTDERQSQLYIFIWRVYQFLIKNEKTTAQKLWNEIQHRHKNHDTEGIIQEVTESQISWCSGYGNEQRLLRTSFNKTLSNIKKSPPA